MFYDVIVWMGYHNCCTYFGVAVSYFILLYHFGWYLTEVIVVPVGGGGAY